jgi:predicted DsbA family dithiol-disulfide isomerase
LFKGRQINIEEVLARLRSVAESLALPFGDRKKTYNSRLAQELGKWAESKDRGAPFHDKMFRVYFSEGKNIAKIPELVTVAEAVGLPGEEAKSVMENRSFKEAVDADWKYAREKGITAVPTFLLNQRAVVGAQPYETLEQLVKACGVERLKK